MLQFPEQFDHLVRLAEAAELRHRVISHNLANVNTPGYRRLDVSFEENLKGAIRRNSSTRSIQPMVVEESGLPIRNDGNNVDLDREIGHLNRNAMLFQTYTEVLSAYLQSMRRAIGR